MDQLKEILQVAKKHYFWIASGLIVVAFLATWYVSISKMQKETADRIQKWNAAFSAAQQIVGIENHPNDESAKAMRQLTEEEAVQVSRAWDRRYREQEDVLKWPEELLPDFIAAVERLKPIELKVEYPTPPQDELRLDLRERYMNYVKNEMPKLAEIIGSVWQAGKGNGTMSSGMGGMDTAMGGMDTAMGGMDAAMGGMDAMAGGMGPMGGMRPMRPKEDEKPIVVVWNAGSQAALAGSRFGWKAAPTTLQLLYTQEDLWVLRALMLIIKATNGDADAQYNAAIKEIEFIQLGADASGIKRVGQVGGMGGSPGGMSGPSSSMMSGPADGDMGSAAGGTGAMDGGMGGADGGMGVRSAADPAENRYVDAENEPLSGTRLREAMKSDAPSDAFLAVAKRMPMRIRLKMNLLKLPLLLSQCANSNLPVEVRQVRINAGGGSSSGTSGGMDGGMEGAMMTGGAGGGMMGGAPGGGMMGGAPGGGMMGGAPGGGMMGAPGGDMMSGGSDGGGLMGGSGMDSMGSQAKSPYDGSVEIYGVIYLYNPVDTKKLGLEEPVPEPTQPTDSTAAATAAQPVVAGS